MISIGNSRSDEMVLADINGVTFRIGSSFENEIYVEVVFLFYVFVGTDSCYLIIVIIFLFLTQRCSMKKKG